MTVHTIACPSCSAPLTVSKGNKYTRCPYCTSTLSVEQKGDQILLLLGDKVITSIHDTSTQLQTTIQEGTQLTQLELRRLQISQDIAAAQMQLSYLQSEIRALERQTLDRKGQQQLRDLRAEEKTIRQRIKTLQDALNPPNARSRTAASTMGTAPAKRFVTSPVSSPTTSAITGKSRNEFLWSIFSFNGRMSRNQFWSAGIPAFILITIALAPASAGSPWATLVTLVAIWIAVALAVKRFRDRNKSGWWVLIMLIPAIGPIWLLIELGFLPSVPETH